MKFHRNILISLILLISIIFMFTVSCNKDDENNDNPTEIDINNTVKDIDGNVYHTVTIGSQVWMVENLKVTQYNDGSELKNVVGNNNWSSLTSGAYCNYDNEKSYVSTYGRLYNWYAVESGKLCPNGWHVPTDAEWIILIDFLGGHEIAGGKLKEIGTTHWKGTNTEATNESGFTALPGGHRNIDGDFGIIGFFGGWWSSTEYDALNAWRYYLTHYSYSHIFRTSSGYKQNGYSVRCIKD